MQQRNQDKDGEIKERNWSPPLNISCPNTLLRVSVTGHQWKQRAQLGRLSALTVWQLSSVERDDLWKPGLEETDTKMLST